MMELQHYLTIIRRYWLLALALPLLVALISLIAALTRPPAYGLATRLLVTRGDVAGETTEGLTESGEDKTAQDLPAIMSGAAFRQDVAQELAQGGRAISADAVGAALGASNQQHVVTLSVTAANPEDAVAIAESAIVVLQRNGLRYWGVEAATPELPGLNVAVLDPPTTAVPLGGLRATVLEVALRTLTGLIAGVGLAFLVHYLSYRRRGAEKARVTSNELQVTNYE